MSVSASQIYDEIRDDLEAAVSDSTAKILSAYDLSYDDINRINRYFQVDLDYEDIVCVVSDSILNIGKSGAVFTKEGFYYKGWMSFQINFVYYSNYEYISDNYRIFYQFFLQNVMRNAHEFIELENRKELRWDGLKEIIGGNDVSKHIYFLIQDIKSIIEIKELEKQFCELQKYSALVYREATIFFTTESVNDTNQVQQITDFANEVINDLRTVTIELSTASADSENYEEMPMAYSEYFARVLLLSITASVILLSISKKTMSIGKFAKGILSFDVDKISSNRDLFGISIAWQEYEDEFVELINAFAEATVEYTSAWEVEEDYVLLESAELLLDCMIKIIEAVEAIILPVYGVKTLENLGKKMMYEKYIDMCNNPVVNSSSELPEDINKIGKKILKIAKQTSQADFWNSVKCVPDMDEGVKYFHRGMFGLLEKTSGFYDYPLLCVILSDYFCSGIIVTNNEIVWNYLPESPEARIIKVITQYNEKFTYEAEELKEGEKGWVCIKDIVDIVACVDYSFVNICLVLRGGDKLFLPISLVSVQYSELLCQLIGTIVYQLTGCRVSKGKAVYSLDEELKKQLNDVLEKYNLLPEEENTLEATSLPITKLSEKNFPIQSSGTYVSDNAIEDKNHSDSLNYDKKQGVLRGCLSIILWLFAVVFCLFGFMLLFGGLPITGIIWIVIGFILKPQKNSQMKIGKKLLISFIGFVLSWFFV